MYFCTGRAKLLLLQESSWAVTWRGNLSTDTGSYRSKKKKGREDIQKKKNHSSAASCLILPTAMAGLLLAIRKMMGYNYINLIPERNSSSSLAYQDTKIHHSSEEPWDRTLQLQKFIMAAFTIICFNTCELNCQSTQLTLQSILARSCSYTLFWLIDCCMHVLCMHVLRQTLF